MIRTERSHAGGSSAADSGTNPVALRFLLGRSLFPIVALALIAGTFWWGPWVTLALTAIWWRIVTSHA